jgi:hypothetical protein
MNPLTFEPRHWTLAAGVCLVAVSPVIWKAFHWGLALAMVCFGLAGIAIGVLSEMVAVALERRPGSTGAGDGTK